MALFDFLKKKEFEQINQLQTQLEKYKPITDIEKEVARQKEILDDLIRVKNAEVNNIEINFTKLNSDYQTALETYTKLRKEVSVFESKLDPHWRKCSTSVDHLMPTNFAPIASGNLKNNS